MGVAHGVPPMASLGGRVKKKILFRGPLLTRSGYGEQSRFALRALASRRDIFDIYIQPIQWGQTSWISEDDAERRWIDETIEKTIARIQQGGTFDVTYQVTIPNEWERKAPVNIGFTAGMETTRVHHNWIQKGNEMDKIIVVSHHAKNTYVNTTYQGTNSTTNEPVLLELTTPVDVVNYPVKHFEDPEPINLDLDYDFNFLLMAQMSPRKNIPNTLRWFIEEFHDEEVGLVAKLNIAKNSTMDRENLFHQLKMILRAWPDRKCKVYLMHGDLTDNEVHSLIDNEKIDAFLTLAHGEGFGLPVYEAAYSGVPVVATGWSGQLDFLVDRRTGTTNFYSVDYDIQPIPEQVVWEGVIIKESMWAYPREKSAKEQMRRCYTELTSGPENPGTTTAKRNAERLHRVFSEEKQYKTMVASVCDAIGIDPSESYDEAVIEFE